VFKADLGCSNNHRLSKVTEHLSSQEMEVVSWHSALSELKVNILCSQVIVGSCRIVSLTVNVLQETLDVTSGVLRASTIESVREEKDHTRLSQPFRFRAL